MGAGHPADANYPKYRPDIDGLRAIAVLAVLGFHAFPEFVHGGFVGVDVFFVISGFLISSIIFANHEQGSFSYSGFYSRRIRRIFPALMVVLAACLVAGWFLLMPSEYSQLSKYTVAGGGFVSNLLSWSEAGYFDNASETKPLLHLWSLGVEEQFYLFWPLLVGLCWRYRFNFLLATLTVAVLSFGINLATVAEHPSADFYSPLSRFWELMLGGVLAYLNLHKPRLPHKYGNLLSVLGLMLIILTIGLLQDGDAFPGWRALLPTLGAFLVMAAPPEALLNRHLLGNRAMVSIGLISYPLYLWHMPLLVFARIVSYRPPSIEVRLALLFTSIVLATATYLLVEKPLRFRMPARRSVTVLVTGIVLAMTAGTVNLALAGVPDRFDEKLRPYLTFPDKEEFMESGRAGTCWLQENARPAAYAPDCVDPPIPGKRLIVLWGDSHAALFYPGLRQADGGRDRLAQFTRNACPPLLPVKRDRRCIRANQYILGRIAALKPDLVILFGRWSRHIFPRAKQSHMADLLSTLNKLELAGPKHIIVMGPAPNWDRSLPQDVARWAINNQADSVPDRMSQFLMPEVAPVDALMKERLSGVPHVEYFSTYGALCDESGCLTTVNGQADGLTTFDYGHFTNAGAYYVARTMMEGTDYFRIATAP